MLFAMPLTRHICREILCTKIAVEEMKMNWLYLVNSLLLPEFLVKSKLEIVVKCGKLLGRSHSQLMGLNFQIPYRS